MVKENTSKQRMLIDATQTDEIRVALTNGSELLDFDFETLSKKPIKGNIYLGKIVRVEPSLQAAFVEYGRNKHGFLAFTEIHPDYFRIPVADRDEVTPSKDEDSPEDAVPTGPDNSEEKSVPSEETEDASALESGSEEDRTTASEVSEDKQSDEDDDDVEAKKKYALYRQYKLQEVIKSKQVVLVQVVKGERGNKGAALTTFISLAGRYCVLMPNSLHPGGISRKITEANDRKRLKQLIEDLDIPEGMSLIVRTAGLDRDKAEIRRDYEYLIELWAQVRENTLQATAPALVYEEPNLVSRAIRDLYTPEIEEMLIEGSDAMKEAKDSMKMLMPAHVKKIKPYADEAVPLFQKYQIEHQIEQIYSSQVKLRSGGYIVISITEALVAIDVNSGRATRERHIDTTALKTNLEAAEEIARQIRIRDLSGLLVIDFIDMNEVRHNIAVEKRLKDSLTKDRARIQVGRISQFGLLEMSRQRLRSSIIEASSVRCPYCVGAGMVRSNESLSLQLLRVLEELSQTYKTEASVLANLSPELALHFLETKRSELSKLEERHGRFFVLKHDDTLQALGFRLETPEGVVIADSTGHKEETTEEKPERSGRLSDEGSPRSERGQRERGQQNSPNNKRRQRHRGDRKASEVATIETSVSPVVTEPTVEKSEVDYENIGNRIMPEPLESDLMEDDIGNRITAENEEKSKANGRRHGGGGRHDRNDRHRRNRHRESGPLSNEGPSQQLASAPSSDSVPREKKERSHERRPKPHVSEHSTGSQAPASSEPRASNRRGWWKKLLDTE